MKLFLTIVRLSVAARRVCVAGFYVTVRRPSFCLSVCLFHRSTAATAGEFAAERHEISIDSCGRAVGAVLQARRSAANVGSVV